MNDSSRPAVRFTPAPAVATAGGRPRPATRLVAAAAALVLALTPLGLAQTTLPAESAVPGLARLQERIDALDLTDDQKQQMQALRAEVAETLRGLAPTLKDLPPDQRREKIRAALGDMRQRFVSVLTPAQRQALKQNVTEQRLPAKRPLAELKAKKQADPPLVAKLRESVLALGLTDEQTPKVEAILDDAAARARAIMQDAAADRTAARAAAVDLATDTRQKLNAVLTAEQKATLADDVRDAVRGRRARRASPPGTRPAPTTTPTADAAATSRPAVAVVGRTVPALNLVRLNGNPVTVRTLAGRPAVLAMGSLSSPAFRDRVPRLDALKQRLGGRAGVYIVYTREAHPAGGPWPVKRNVADKIEAEQPRTLQDRIALATRLRERTKTTVEILVDAMDDATLGTFGDKPDAAAVLGPTGTLVAVQNFCDPSGLPRLVDEAMKAKG